MNMEEYLKSLPRETFYYCPNRGNGGDSLIAHATYQMLRRCNVNFEDIRVTNVWSIGKPLDDLSGKCVIFGGGGNLVGNYRNGANFLKECYPVVKKLIILPHTINSHQGLLTSFGKNVDIICREPVSYNYVKNIVKDANVMLADDMVFNLDLEKTFNRKVNLLGSSYALRYFPRLVKQSMYASRYSLEVQLSSFLGDGKNVGSKVLNCFRKDSEKVDFDRGFPNFDLTEKFAFYDFSEPLVHEVSYRLLRYLSGFEIVNTNRLHVCIASALLGKSVNFYPNSYYKNLSVYNHSIKNRFKNVRWMG